MQFIFAMLLCSNSGSSGQFCVIRDFRALDDCKAFVAAAERETQNKSGMRSMYGVCIPEQRSLPGGRPN